MTVPSPCHTLGWLIGTTSVERHSRQLSRDLKFSVVIAQQPRHVTGQAAWVA
jgi:hypothetical protein